MLKVWNILKKMNMRIVDLLNIMSKIIEAFHLTNKYPDSVFILPKIKITLEENGKKKISKMCSMCNMIEEKDCNFMKCSNCKVSIYCSKKCQKKHWKSHKKYCPNLDYYTDNKTKNCSRILQRTFYESYATYINTIDEKKMKDHKHIFNDDDKFLYVEDYDEEFFLLHKSTQDKFQKICELNNWEVVTEHWKILFGECIDGKLLIDKQK